MLAQHSELFWMRDSDLESIEVELLSACKQHDDDDGPTDDNWLFPSYCKSLAPVQKVLDLKMACSYQLFILGPFGTSATIRA